MKLSKLNQPNKVNKKTDSKLVKKWQAIQRQINQNKNLDKKMREFAVKCEKRLRKPEQEFLEERARLVIHLCEYLPRKTLTKTALMELTDYIDDEIDLIQQHPFCKPNQAQRLVNCKIQKLQERQDKYSQDPKQIQKLREHIESMPWMTVSLTDEQLAEFVRDPDKGQQIIDEYYDAWLETQGKEAEDKFDDTEYQQDWESEDDNDFFENIFGQGTDQQYDNAYNERQTKIEQQGEDLLKKLMRSNEINRLYKKLANILHPDKLKDKSKQSEYLLAMKLLITARKNKDLFELLSIAQRYLPEHELALDKHQEKQLSVALDKKLKELQAAHFDAENAHSANASLWRRFYHKNERQLEKNFENQIIWLQQIKQQSKQIVASTTSVKQVKLFLREHFEKRDIEAMQFLQDKFFGEFDVPFDEDFPFDRAPY